MFLVSLQDVSNDNIVFNRYNDVFTNALTNRTSCARTFPIRFTARARSTWVRHRSRERFTDFSAIRHLNISDNLFYLNRRVKPSHLSHKTKQIFLFLNFFLESFPYMTIRLPLVIWHNSKNVNVHAAFWKWEIYILVVKCRKIVLVGICGALLLFYFNFLANT